MTEFFQDLMRGIFLPLGLFSVLAAWSLWRLVAWPAVKDGTVWRYSIGMGGALIAFALALESVTYGLVRWLPTQFYWIGAIYAWVLLPKIIYIAGILMIESAHVPEDKRVHRLLRLSLVAIALWAAGTVAAKYTV
jgi:hypothetical protein